MSNSSAGITPDSSVVIAAFASWNTHHEAAIEALGDARDLIAHAELETYSVLTRLPEPQRAAPALVAQYLREDYTGKRLFLPDSARRGLLDRLAGLSIAGGAVYDALVGATAAHYGYRLLSCDRRAEAVYVRLGVEVVYL
ncbi:MAG TPA: type II toxin-antitoxin system VapC family toxin [Solirubrobacteraceae bacterium]|nr:type II toxin-antitoxin system VapC family toxin [Solirubrobacteraceae bacterium]